MIEKYLRYNEINREVLQSLRRHYDEDGLAPMLQEREELFQKFEEAGWPDAEKAEIIIRDALKIERECVKVIAARRSHSGRN